MSETRYHIRIPYPKWLWGVLPRGLVSDIARQAPERERCNGAFSKLLVIRKMLPTYGTGARATKEHGTAVMAQGAELVTT